MNREMKSCRLCGSTTSGQRNDEFDDMILDIKTLARYVIDQRFNQAGNVLISSATKLMATFDGCCTDDEHIQKYGHMTIELIKLGQEISRMDSNGAFDKEKPCAKN